MALTSDAVRDSYDVMAPFYDRFTAHHDHETWTRRLEALARARGLTGRRLLDVGCGTGKSFLPMLARGYAVVACDVAPAMAAAARAKAPAVPVHVCDVRELPRLGRFDLVWSLDDCLNHLLDRAALERALARIADNLADGGIALFDLNTLATYRGFFAGAAVEASDDALIAWRGRTDPAAGPGSLARAELTSFSRTGAGWERVTVAHVQRHHPEPEVRAALAAAGLRRVAVYGHGLDGAPHPGVDELRDTKAVYVAERR